ncbi:MAG: hypothetical protein Kow0059_19100 [Candidatus Sumerlaeia bacterium]
MNARFSILTMAISGALILAAPAPAPAVDPLPPELESAPLEEQWEFIEQRAEAMQELKLQVAHDRFKQRQQAKQKLASQWRAEAAAQIAKIRAEKNRHQAGLHRSHFWMNTGLLVGLMMIVIGSAGLLDQFRQRKTAALLPAHVRRDAAAVQPKPGLTRQKYFKWKQRLAREEYRRDMWTLVQQTRLAEARANQKSDGNH